MQIGDIVADSHNFSDVVKMTLTLLINQRLKLSKTFLKNLSRIKIQLVQRL